MQNNTLSSYSLYQALLVVEDWGEEKVALSAAVRSFQTEPVHSLDL